MKIWEKIKKAYTLIHSEKIDNSLELFEEIYNFIEKDELEKESNLFNNYISCLLGLWEIYMKKRDFKKSLGYYNEWYKLTDWKDFNVLFNLWVVYHNLWDTKKSEEILNKAKKINPKDTNLIRFLWEISQNFEEEDKNQNINKNFEEKIKKLIEELK